MASLTDSAVVGTLNAFKISANEYDPPLTGVINPLNANLSIGNNNIVNANNVSCSNLIFATLNGAPVGGGTVANPLVVALDGNGPGGPYSFENIGVGACATLTAGGNISAGILDATTGTITCTGMTVQQNAAVKDMTTVSNLTTASGNSAFTGITNIVGNGNITQNFTGGDLTVNNINGGSITCSGDTNINGGVLTCTTIADSGALSGVDMTTTGDLSATDNLFLSGGGGNLTANALQAPIHNSLGTPAAPLNALGVNVGTISMGENNGKGVVYAYAAAPGPNYPIEFDLSFTNDNPIDNGTLEISGQLYQNGGGPAPNYVKAIVFPLTATTVRVITHFDGPSSATTTNRINVNYIAD
jgi:hypothetical protein